MDAEVTSEEVTSEIEQQQREAAKRKFKSIHDRIFGEISSMLKKARVVPIEHLSEENPSFLLMTEELEFYRPLLEKIAPEFGLDLNVLADLDIYLKLIRSLAEAIEEGCSDSLGAAIAALDVMPYV